MTYELLDNGLSGKKLQDIRDLENRVDSELVEMGLNETGMWRYSKEHNKVFFLYYLDVPKGTAPYLKFSYPLETMLSDPDRVVNEVTFTMVFQ
jgi:hypothetical protein